MTTYSVVLPIQGTTAQFDRGSTASPPSTPANFTATPGNEEVILAWDAVSDILRYHIYYDTSTGVTTSDTRIQIDSDQVTHTLTGLTNGTTYYFKVAAVGSGGESTLSAEKSATPTSFDNTLSMLFDGVDERVVTTASGISGSGARSVSFWIKTTGAAIPFSYGGSGALAQFLVQVNTNKLNLLINGSNVQFTATNILDGNWHHCVIAYAAGAQIQNATAFMDGSSLSVATSVAGTSVLATGSSVTIELGRDGIAPGSYLNGNLDEVSFWDKSLSLAEVQEIYNSGDPLNLDDHSAVANLDHWWRMGEGGTISNIPDEIGTDDGSPINMEAADIEADVPS